MDKFMRVLIRAGKKNWGWLLAFDVLMYTGWFAYTSGLAQAASEWVGAYLPALSPSNQEAASSPLDTGAVISCLALSVTLAFFVRDKIRKVHNSHV